MILRDPIHGLISFEGRAERLVEALLDTREVQRLRRVRQLGMASVVYPGAEHSRFSHAIGAAHVMVRLQERIVARQDDLPQDQRLDEEASHDALAAALLHDLGHGPFSHLFEDVLPHARHHEAWTVDAIRDDGTDVHRALARFSRGMPERVAGLLAGEYRLAYLARAVSGSLDVDRADYLLRDSHMTGVRYGLYDLDWLLRAFAFGRVGGEWVLAIEGRKGLPPIENFFLARHFMYQQVYHHKAVRAAEALIRSIFVRLTERIRDGRPPGPVPKALEASALGQPLSLGEYLDLDDARLVSAMAEWEAGPEDELGRLCRALRDRRLPKTIPLPEEPESSWTEAEQRARAIVARSGARPDLSVWLDVPSDVPYAEPEGEVPDGLWLSLRHRPIQRLGAASFLLRELRNKRIVRPRLIVPGEAREAVLGAIADLIA
jgi:HD superfamily phosphohydrolase